MIDDCEKVFFSLERGKMCADDHTSELNISRVLTEPPSGGVTPLLGTYVLREQGNKSRPAGDGAGTDATTGRSAAEYSARRVT